MKNELVLYRLNNSTEHIEVRLEDDTVWLSRSQLAQLFDRDVKTIGKYINNRMNRLEDNFENLKSKVTELDVQIHSRLIPTQGVFFDGQVFDAYELASKIIRSAQNSIILI
jgi:hypothetical protein